MKEDQKFTAEISDTEFGIQLIKIFLGFVFGLALVAILYHIHMDLLRIEQLLLLRHS
jgi:hypothetical protein